MRAAGTVLKPDINTHMNKTELKTYLAKMSKAELETMVLNIHSQFPRVRELIYDTVNPPVIDWEQLYNTCRDYVIEASTSNKINRLGVPAAALSKFTQYGPEKDIALDYIYDTFDILVRGLLFLKYRDTFHYSFVGNYANDCKKYMKKRKWLNDEVDAQFKEIVERYFEGGSDGHKWILHFAEVQ